MKMNCGYSVNKGQSSALLVPASATKKPPVHVKTGFAVFLCLLFLKVNKSNGASS